MGYILDRINTKLPKALDGKLGDAVESFTATRTTAGEYDPVTGTTTGSTETWQGRWIRQALSMEMVDGQHILATDAQRMIMTAENDWVPKIDDVANSMRVTNVTESSAGTHHIVHLRRT